jgi:hypothetical protein
MPGWRAITTEFDGFYAAIGRLLVRTLWILDYFPPASKCLASNCIEITIRGESSGLRVATPRIAQCEHKLRNRPHKGHASDSMQISSIRLSRGNTLFCPMVSMLIGIVDWCDRQVTHDCCHCGVHCVYLSIALPTNVV